MNRIVLVGHGMVGAHLLAGLAGHGVHGVTVLAPEAPVQRPLLTDVVAGRLPAELAGLAPEPPRGTTLVRAAAVGIDRARRVVQDAAGGTHPYDTLVLATGARPVAPPHPRARVVRSLADAVSVAEAAASARSALVVGTGPLGLEVACGLRLRGLDVVLAGRGAHVLGGRLDEASAGILVASLADLGIEVRAGCADPWAIPADLVVACLGVRASTGLARRAGLAVRQGILTGDAGRTADPAIAAVGDAAQREGAPWRPNLADGLADAGRLARRLAGVQDAGVDPPRGSTRLRAPGLDVGLVGDVAPAPGTRVVTLLDRQARRAVRLAVRQGRLAGATAVGAGDVFGDLALAHAKGSGVPADPAHLLVRGPVQAPGPDADPLAPFVPAVCRCNGVSADDVATAFHAGACDIGAVATATRATTGCGGCTDRVRCLLADLHAARSADAA